VEKIGPTGGHGVAVGGATGWVGFVTGVASSGAAGSGLEAGGTGAGLDMGVGIAGFAGGSGKAVLVGRSWGSG
jgi:hypothetical protein